MKPLRVNVVSLPNLDDDNRDIAPLAALYTIERQMGFTVQSGLFAIWAASATYLAAAAAVLALAFGDGSESLFDSLQRSWVLAVLPFPAFALAGYHAILFGIGMIHSKSIALLEENLVAHLPPVFAACYQPGSESIGAKAETNWTDFKLSTLPMKIVAILAYSVPYASAIGIAFFCLNQIMIDNGVGSAFALGGSSFYLLALITIAWLLAKTIRMPDHAKRPGFV